MLDCKFKVYYFEELATRYQIIDRRLNIFLALASSSSIATWAIWQRLDLLWAIILAVATLVNVIKPYFPFNKYLAEINKMSTQLELLHLDFEKLWYKLEHNKIDEDAIFEEFMELKKGVIEILNVSEEIILVDNKKIEGKANEDMNIYLKNNFSIPSLN